MVLHTFPDMPKFLQTSIAPWLAHHHDTIPMSEHNYNTACLLLAVLPNFVPCAWK